MSYPITIFAVKNPSGSYTSAYTSDFDANKFLKKCNDIEEGWEVEPLSLQVTEKFYFRLKDIFDATSENEDVIEADTEEVQSKKKLSHKKRS